MNHNNNPLCFQFHENNPRVSDQIAHASTSRQTDPRLYCLLITMKYCCTVMQLQSVECMRRGSHECAIPPPPFGWKIITLLPSPVVIRISCPWVSSARYKSPSDSVSLYLWLHIIQVELLSQPTVIAVIDHTGTIFVSDVEVWQEGKKKKQLSVSITSVNSLWDLFLR